MQEPYICTQSTYITKAHAASCASSRHFCAPAAWPLPLSSPSEIIILKILLSVVEFMKMDELRSVVFVIQQGDQTLYRKLLFVKIPLSNEDVRQHLPNLFLQGPVFIRNFDPLDRNLRIIRKHDVLGELDVQANEIQADDLVYFRFLSTVSIAKK